MSVDEEVVPTKCEDWSLNMDDASGMRYWWNATYSLSVWENTLDAGDAVADLTDTAVWAKYIAFQEASVYKLCPICREPEGNVDMKICCYCSATVHVECSQEAAPAQIIWKAANNGLEKILRVCLECQDVEYPKKVTSSGKHEPDNARRAAARMLTLQDELPAEAYDEMQELYTKADKVTSASASLMEDVKRATRDFFQSPASVQFLTKGKIATKGGGVGVVAAADIPAFVVVGVYPGYLDELSGEQAKMGRPVPKYALMDLNCANYFNEVFVEFSTTFCPFINEPCEAEVSNCAWIQEPSRPEGRLSIISVMDIKKGDELLIGYGPLYPRDYRYQYDSYAFHPVEGYEDPICYALWHWPSKDENDTKFICYLGYDKASDSYSYWESQDETDVKQGGN